MSKPQHPILQAHYNLKEDAPGEAAEMMAETLEANFPSELTCLYLCVYRLMLDFPGLEALDAMEVVAKIGILLERKEGEA